MNILTPKYIIISKVKRPLKGNIRVPGSKSITNRALILAALAQGKSTLSNVLFSDDTEVMINALTEMGVQITLTDPSTIIVNSTGKLLEPDKPLFLGNAGTATRFLTAVCALIDGKVVIDGDDYMRKRPISPLVDALRAMGFVAECPTGCPPVKLYGKHFINTDHVTVNGDLSSQYVSALLMIAPFCQRYFNIYMTNAHIGGRGYIDLTIALMNKFGVDVQTTNKGWHIATQNYIPTDYVIEPDASSATYIWAIQALLNADINIGIHHNDITQPDAKAYDIIHSFPNFSDEIDGSQCQDAIPTIAVMAAFSGKKIRFIGIENLRVKECDRVAALREGLCRIQPKLAIEEGNDLIVNGDMLLPTNSRHTIFIDSKDDHRMAMAFSLAGMKLGNVAISNYQCVSKTFPSYWEELEKIGVVFNLLEN